MSSYQSCGRNALQNGSDPQKGSVRETGQGNTRLDQEVSKRLEVAVDYLRVKASYPSWSQAERAIDYVCQRTNYLKRECIPFALGSGAPIYESSFTTPRGIRGGWKEIPKLDGTCEYELIVDIPGQYLSVLTLVEQVRYIRGLKHCYGFHSTRLDVALDDKSCEQDQFPIQEMVAACERGDVHLFQSYQFIPGKLNCSTGERKNDTHYFGSRESRKFIRAYPHQSFWRLEAEFKRGSQQEVFDFLADFEAPFGHSLSECQSAIAQTLASYIVGAIDFVNKSEKKGFRDGKRINAGDCKRLSFWQKLVDRVGGSIQTKVPQRITSLSKTFDWIERQGGKFLTKVYKAMDPLQFRSWIHDITVSADQRWTNKDELDLEQLRYEFQKGYQTPREYRKRCSQMEDWRIARDYI